MITDKSIKLFRKAYKEIPAYRAFLKENNFKPESVKALEDFGLVPVTSKKNYLAYNLIDDLAWKKSLENPLLLCSTSGSTGEPYYFPRNDDLSWQYSFLIEDFLSRRPSKKTLVLLGFGMGVWIGGVITLRAFEIAGARMKAPISILPTGYNKPEIFKALKKLASNYDQTIIIGYPPFIKELVDEAPKEKINLKNHNVRFLFAAEAFTENFRDYLCRKAGVKNPVIDTLNIYGTADIGAMAYETPQSIMIRRIATKNKKIYKEIFGQIEKTPTLAQYNSKFIEFETVDDQVILTGDAALPLIRYSIGDHGGVISSDYMRKLMKKHGIDLDKEAKKHGITEPLNSEPYIYVYERIDLSATLHGINIYPEFIKEGLIHDSLTPYLTERFTMVTRHDNDHNQYLEINFELQDKVRPSLLLKRRTEKIIREKLLEKSSEFVEISKTRHSKNLLKMNFWPNGNPRYFTPGTKQKWVQSEEMSVK